MKAARKGIGTGICVPGKIRHLKLGLTRLIASA
jgi:hypothetical protein